MTAYEWPISDRSSDVCSSDLAFESAQNTADYTEEYVSGLTHLLMIGAIAIIAPSIIVTWYIGRAISAPITEMIGILTSIAAGKLAADVPGQHRRDEIGAMARAVAVFDRVTRDLRDRAKLLEDAWQHAESANEIGRAHDRTPVTNAHHVFRLL